MKKLLARGLALIVLFASGDLMAQIDTWGHQGWAGGGNFIFSGNDQDRFAIRFTEQGNRSVNAAWLYVASISGTSPVYQIGIQGDSAGNPDGNFIQSADYTHTGGTGWVKVALPEASLTDGTVYHLVVQYQSGTIDSGNNIRFSAVSQQYMYIPPTMIEDVNLRLARWVSAGGFWFTLANTPSFLLEYTDGDHYGVAYRSSLVQNIKGSERAAQRFFVPETIPVASLELHVDKLGTPPADLEYKITNLTTPSTVISGVFATESQVATSSGNDIVTPIDGVTLHAGEIYRLELYCPACVNGHHYRVRGRSTMNDSSPFVENTFQGGVGYSEISSDSGSSWTADLAGDWKFLFELDTNRIFSDGFEPDGFEQELACTMGYYIIPGDPSYGFDADGDGPIGEQVAIANISNEPANILGCTVAAFDCATGLVSFAESPLGNQELAPYTGMRRSTGFPWPADVIPDGPGAMLLVDGAVTVGTSITNVLPRLVAGFVYATEDDIINMYKKGQDASTYEFLTAIAACSQ